jgi:hypothetical protein
MNCEYCKDKCNTCIHKDEQVDISDEWEDEDPILIDGCDHDYKDCERYKPDGYYCKMCGYPIKEIINRQPLPTPPSPLKMYETLIGNTLKH